MKKIIYFLSVSLLIPQIVFANLVNDRVDWRLDSNGFRSHAGMKQNVTPIDRSTLDRYPEIKIDPQFLKLKLSEFSGAIPAMIAGKQVRITERGSKEGRNLARAYLAQEYSRIGFKVDTQTYEGGANFIAEKIGADTSRVLILSAHLDSMDNAGADDDGSGTISALAIASALADSPLKYNLRVLGFDQEEEGLVGSVHYIKSLSSTQLQQIVGDINLEMTSYDSKNLGRFHVIDCNRAESIPFSTAFLAAIEALHLPLTRSTACTDRSDHASFWSAKRPAIVISQDFFGGNGNPCYHESCDSIEHLNFEYMANITRAAASVVAAALVAR